MAVGGGGPHVITPADGMHAVLDLPVHPSSGKYAESTPVDPESRSFFPATAAATGESDVYSVKLGGTDLRQLTSFPANVEGWTAIAVVLAPEETRLAFINQAAGILLMDTDGTDLHVLTDFEDMGPSWQPVPATP